MNNTEATEILKRQSACEKAECFNECADCPNDVPDDEFITALDTVISAMEKQERWIPVTEELPEEEGLYLVAVKNDHERRYSKTAWFYHGSWSIARQKVIAWRYLPEPYKEEK